MTDDDPRTENDSAYVRELRAKAEARKLTPAKVGWIALWLAVVAAIFAAVMDGDTTSPRATDDRGDASSTSADDLREHVALIRDAIGDVRLAVSGVMTPVEAFDSVSTTDERVDGMRSDLAALDRPDGELGDAYSAIETAYFKLDNGIDHTKKAIDDDSMSEGRDASKDFAAVEDYLSNAEADLG
jgi:hypothetical protein